MTRRESTVRFYDKQNMKWLHIGVVIAENMQLDASNTPERRGRVVGGGVFAHATKSSLCDKPAAIQWKAFFNVEQSTLHNHMCLRYVDLLDLDHQIGGIGIKPLIYLSPTTCRSNFSFSLHGNSP